MKKENLEQFMDKITIVCKELSEYKNNDTGLLYPLSTATLLTRVDYLELTKEELEKAKFEEKVEKKDYQMYECERIVPKYEITKIEADKYTLTNKKIKATHIYNVSNQVGIIQTFEDKEAAFKLCDEINKKVYDVIKG